MTGDSLLTYLRKLKPYWNRCRSSIYGMIFTRTLCTILGLLLPLLYRFYMNHVLMKKNTALLAYVIIGYVILYLSLTVFGAMEQLYQNRIQNHVKIRLKREILYIYQSLPITEYDKFTSGDLRNRVETDIEKIPVFLVKHIINRCFSILNILLFIVVMFLLNWQLTLFSLVSIGFTCIITRVIGKRIHHITDRYRSSYGELESMILHSLHNWKEIKTNNLENEQINQLDSRWKAITALLKKQTLYQALSTVIVVANTAFLTRLGMYFIGGILVFYHQIDVASLLVFITYYEKLQGEMNTLTQSMIAYQGDLPSVERIAEILNILYEKKKPLRLKGTLEVKQVNFQYEEGGDILHDVNLHITERQHTAIIGKSGCGKSTLVKLLLGILKPQEGTVTIGGTDIYPVADRSKCRTICAVMQDPKFFNLSIADNLRLINKDATAKELDDVCKMANIYEFIQGLPQRYDTIIGERGIKLSGGQLQRLAIARILLRDPDIIIFDEATSALDNESEKEIISVINKLLKKKTIISIAHRFSSITGADHVVMLRDGKIAAEGTLRELIECNDG